jgi:hypothetical protein
MRRPCLNLAAALALIEGGPDPATTACGMLVDMINIARGRHRPA